MGLASKQGQTVGVVVAFVDDGGALQSAEKLLDLK